MLCRGIWPLFGLVVTAHLAVIEGFFESTSLNNVASEQSKRLTVHVIEGSTLDAAIPAYMLLAKAPALTPTPAPAPKPIQGIAKTPLEKADILQKTLVDNYSELSGLSDQKSLGFTVNAPVDRRRYLDFDALDQSAISSLEFEAALAKALPMKFEQIMLEFLIDETGRTVLVSCIEGDCSTTLAADFQQLLALPFEPALKNGQAVASRKIIQVLPLAPPTF